MMCEAVPTTVRRVSLSGDQTHEWTHRCGSSSGRTPGWSWPCVQCKPARAVNLRVAVPSWRTGSRWCPLTCCHRPLRGSCFLVCPPSASTVGALTPLREMPVPAPADDGGDGTILISTSRHRCSLPCLCLGAAVGPRAAANTRLLASTCLAPVRSCHLHLQAT